MKPTTFALSVSLFLGLAFSASAQEPAALSPEATQVAKEVKAALARAERAEAALKAREEADAKAAAAAQKAAEEAAAKKDWNFAFGADVSHRTTWGEKTGERVNEFLTNLRGEVFTKHDSGCPKLRVAVDGTWGISGNADDIVPGQSNAEHCELQAAFTSFTYGNSHDLVEGWEVQYQRVSASPLGIEERDAANVFPYVVESFERGNWGRFAIGARYESQSYDPAFLNKMSSLADPNEYNIGLYCEAKGRIYTKDQGKGIYWGPAGHVFLSELDRMERWNAHLEFGVPLLEDVQNCHIALEIGYTDDHGEIGRSRYIAITGIIPF